MAHNGDRPTEFEVAIVGTGFAGIGAAVKLKQAGIDDFVVLERADDVGGTWRDNTYPGCQCDVPSTLYSFSFAPNPSWTHTYPLQTEIWHYLRQISSDRGVTPHVRFRHEVTAAAWDEGDGRWQLDTTGGRISARVLVLGTGALSEPSIPIPGLEQFEGTVFHSAEWNHEHDLRGERVAVIGTGASAIQFVPRIQRDVAELQLYQRTAPWILPHPDRPTMGLERWLWRTIPRSQHAWRALVYAARETMVLGLTVEPRLMMGLELVARSHLRAQVHDPELRRKLTPRYRLGCKRILVSNDYYPALSRPNVNVLTGGVQEVTRRGIRGKDGTEREVDTIIFGTGFQVTDPPSAHLLRGRGGVSLKDAWRETMSAYLGTTVAGFPNLFILGGPNTGLGHTSMVYMLESQIAYMADALKTMRARGAATIDVRDEVQQTFNDELQARLAGTVWNSGGCQSWYLDSSGRNTTLWPSFTFRFRERTRRFDESAYVFNRNGSAHARTRPPAHAPAGTGAHARQSTTTSAR